MVKKKLAKDRGGMLFFLELSNNLHSLFFFQTDTNMAQDHSYTRS